MVKFTSLSKFRILDFFQVASNISAHLDQYSLQTLKLDGVAADFRASLALLDTALKPLRLSAETQQLHLLDARRDNALVGLSVFLKSFSRSPEEAKRTAAAKLRAELEKYGKSPQLLPLREETAMITNFLQDMAKPENAQFLTEVGATAWITELQTTNDEFESRYNARIQENALMEVGKTKEARQDAQAKLTKLIQTINARELLDEDNPNYKKLADEIDQEIKQAKTLYKSQPKDRGAPAK